MYFTTSRAQKRCRAAQVLFYRRGKRRGHQARATGIARKVLPEAFSLNNTALWASQQKCATGSTQKCPKARLHGFTGLMEDN
jgi:hypothetical protein